MSEHPSEQGHFYDPKTGEPRYTYINAKGETKNTTLRECRKFGWVPSVTEIIKMAAKPALQNWIQDQILLAALTLPKIENEPEVDYIARIKKDAKEQAKRAAEKGTLIHALVQQGFEGKVLSEEGMRYFRSASKTLDDNCPMSWMKWVCERSFATERYGGKVDLHSDKYLIDIKSTDKDLATIKTWDENNMQLAAYKAGVSPGRLLRCGILYVNSITAESKLLWITQEDIDRGYWCFDALLTYWYAKNKL